MVTVRVPCTRTQLKFYLTAVPCAFEDAIKHYNGVHAFNREILFYLQPGLKNHDLRSDSPEACATFVEEADAVCELMCPKARQDLALYKTFQSTETPIQRWIIDWRNWPDRGHSLGVDDVEGPSDTDEGASYHSPGGQDTAEAGFPHESKRRNDGESYDANHGMTTGLSLSFPEHNHQKSCPPSHQDAAAIKPNPFEMLMSHRLSSHRLLIGVDVEDCTRSYDELGGDNGKDAEMRKLVKEKKRAWSAVEATGDHSRVNRPPKTRIRKRSRRMDI